MLQPNEIYLNGNNSTVQIASAHETSKTFSYNGNEVLFDIKDDVMVNATQLAKIYGKRPNDYLSLPATNQLINAITRKYGISENQLVISKAGSSHNGGGTWMHEDVALEFLSTLSAVRIIPLTRIISIFLMTFNTPQYALPVISAICSELIVLFSPFSPSIGINLLKFSISLRYKINIVPRWRLSHFLLQGFILTDCSR